MCQLTGRPAWLAFVSVFALLSPSLGQATPFLTADVTQAVSGLGGCTLAVSGVPGSPAVANCPSQTFSAFGGSGTVGSSSSADFDGLRIVAVASARAENTEYNASAVGHAGSHDDLIVFSSAATQGFTVFHGQLTGGFSGTAPDHPFASADAHAVYDLRGGGATALCSTAIVIGNPATVTGSCDLIVPVVFGQAFELVQFLEVGAAVHHVRGEGGGLDFGAASADFSNTAWITSVELFDANMVPISGSIVASSGHLYSIENPAAVPEPNLTIVGLVLGWGVARRRWRRAGRAGSRNPVK